MLKYMPVSLVIAIMSVNCTCTDTSIKRLSISVKLYKL